MIPFRTCAFLLLTTSLFAADLVEDAAAILQQNCTPCHGADKQRGDPHALDREGDPRGGLQNDEYRHAEPTDLVETDGVVMSGPGGAPQYDDD